MIIVITKKQDWEDVISKYILKEEDVIDPKMVKDK